MKTVFVTGAEGFCGRRLVPYLQSKGYEVVGGVRNRGRKLAFEREFGKALVCEVSDAIVVARAIASVKPDAVVHLAGESRRFNAEQSPLTAYQSIPTAWANVCDAVRRTNPRARLLFVSSADVYGAGATDPPCTEDTPCKPYCTFGDMKLAAESIARTYHRNFHLDVMIARPFTFTGGGQSENFFFGSVAKQLCEWDPVIDGDEFKLPDLDCRRDVLHVQDVVRALGAMLESGKPNETYNVCSGEAVSVRELVQFMCQQSGAQVRIGDLPTDEQMASPVMCGSFSKLQQQCNWQPECTWQQAVSDLVQSFQAQIRETTNGQ